MKTEYKKASADDPNIDDSPPALISDNDILKFFNLERDNVQEITFTHKSDGLYVGITLNQKYCQCPVCGNMTKKIKDYKKKKNHSFRFVRHQLLYHLQGKKVSVLSL